MSLTDYLKDKQVVAVVDLGYGDSGKGKVSHRLAYDLRTVVRCTGGPNTGATLFVNGKKYTLHLIPAGIVVPETLNVVTGMVVVNPATMAEEIKKAKDNGFLDSSLRLVIHEKLPVIFPYHIAEDKLADVKKDGKAIGTTGRGVGPAMKDFVGRQDSVVLIDLIDEAKLEERLGQILRIRQKTLDAIAAEKGIDKKEWFKHEFEGYIDSEGNFNSRKIASILNANTRKIEPYITNADEVLRHNYKRGEKILIEGTQGALLDVVHGVRPFVTSSPVTANGLAYASGLPQIDYFVCITKALPTKVGEGPLPTEILGEEANRLRELGSEYGATTGRPRRLYWPNLSELKYALGQVGRNRGIAITKFDILGGISLTVYNGYYLRRIDKRTGEFKNDARFLGRIRGGASQVFGPFEDVRGIKDSVGLIGTNVENYIQYLEDELGTPVIMVGNGPGCFDNIER